MKLLALDIATIVGFAAGEVGAQPIYGHFDLKPAGEWPGRVFSNYRRWLSRQIDVLSPTRVFAEDQFHARSMVVARRLLGLRAITEMLCDERDLPLRWVGVSTLAEFFTGQGHYRNSEAKKAATMVAAERLGWRPAVSDEADALAVFLWGEHQIAPQVAGRRSAGPIFQRELYTS